jgi:hypothetical protein
VGLNTIMSAYCCRGLGLKVSPPELFRVSMIPSPLEAAAGAPDGTSAAARGGGDRSSNMGLYGLKGELGD